MLQQRILQFIGGFNTVNRVFNANQLLDLLFPRQGGQGLGRLNHRRAREFFGILRDRYSDQEEAKPAFLVLARLVAGYPYNFRQDVWRWWSDFALNGGSWGLLAQPNIENFRETIEALPELFPLECYREQLGTVGHFARLHLCLGMWIHGTDQDWQAERDSDEFMTAFSDLVHAWEPPMTGPPPTEELNELVKGQGQKGRIRAWMLPLLAGCSSIGWRTIRASFPVRADEENTTAIEAINAKVAGGGFIPSDVMSWLVEGGWHALDQADALQLEDNPTGERMLAAWIGANPGIALPEVLEALLSREPRPDQVLIPELLKRGVEAGQRQACRDLIVEANRIRPFQVDQQRLMVNQGWLPPDLDSVLQWARAGTLHEHGHDLNSLRMLVEARARTPIGLLTLLMVHHENRWPDGLDDSVCTGLLDPKHRQALLESWLDSGAASVPAWEATGDGLPKAWSNLKRGVEFALGEGPSPDPGNLVGISGEADFWRAAWQERMNRRASSTHRLEDLLAIDGLLKGIGQRDCSETLHWLNDLPPVARCPAEAAAAGRGLAIMLDPGLPQNMRQAMRRCLALENLPASREVLGRTFLEEAYRIIDLRLKNGLMPASQPLGPGWPGDSDPVMKALGLVATGGSDDTARVLLSFHPDLDNLGPVLIRVVLEVLEYVRPTSHRALLGRLWSNHLQIPEEYHQERLERLICRDLIRRALEKDRYAANGWDIALELFLMQNTAKQEVTDLIGGEGNPDAIASLISDHFLDGLITKPMARRMLLEAMNDDAFRAVTWQAPGASAIEPIQGFAVTWDAEGRKAWGPGWRELWEYGDVLNKGQGPARWYAALMGIPQAAAGQPGAAVPPARVVVEAPRLAPLTPWQRELSEHLGACLDRGEGHNRALLALPTGSGKTRTCVEGVLRWLFTQERPGHVLWIMPQKELGEQALTQFQQVWREGLWPRKRGPEPEDRSGRPLQGSLSLLRAWGDYDSDNLREAIQHPGEARGVAFTTPIALLNCLEQLQGNPQTPLHVRAVVFDEAHRILAEDWSRGVRIALGLMDLQDSRIFSPSEVPLLGLTATPYRGGQSSALLRAFHDHVVGLHAAPLDLGNFPNNDAKKAGLQQFMARSRAELVRAGVLAVAVRHVRTTRCIMRNLTLNPFQDIRSQDLEAIGNSATRTEAVVDAIGEWKEQGLEIRTLVFTASVAEARRVAVRLETRGIRARALDGTTHTASRERAIGQFQRGEIQVLVNCELLTTGFDAPQVAQVIIARPTTSMVLYEQMVGRGLRGELFGGTRECVVLDIMDTLNFTNGNFRLACEDFWSNQEAVAGVSPG